MDCLRCKGIVKRFGGVVALDGVSLTVERGKTTGIVGSNGAGKTTLFNLVTGFIRPDRGVVEYKMGSGWAKIQGKKPYQLAKLGIGRTFQCTRLFLEYTCLENLALMEREPGLGASLLKSAGLQGIADRKPASLSCYEARVAEMLRAVAAGASLLFLDEPAAGMNPEETAGFADVLELLRETERLTVVLIEHDMELVKRLCSQVYVMDSGRVLAGGSFSSVMGERRVREVLIGEEE